MQWGYRYLMCPPDYYDVTYAINPWMDADVSVDRDLAARQWRTLKAALERAGATVEVLPAQAGLPDMVFTANHGVVANGKFVAARLAHEQRQPESAHTTRWMTDNGVIVHPESTSGCHEGAGDCLPWGQELIAGYGQRSDLQSWQDIAAATGWTIHPIQLIDPRFYHIDLVLCPLDENHAIVAPTGVAPQDLPRLLDHIAEPVILTPKEELQFMMNSVVVGTTVVMPACSDRVRHILREWGFSVVVVDVSEFIKAGGAVRCLTLALDVALQSTTS
jgi:arginine dihydrolase